MHSKFKIIRSIFFLLRPQQWLKNLFVLAPAFFSGTLLLTDVILNSLLVFISFSSIASTAYIFNDWIDRDADSNHYEKKERPIASGMISFKTAVVTASFMIIISVLICILFLNHSVLLIIVVYFILNLTYTLILKSIAIIDVTCIAVGFVLRLFAGSEATNIELSSWIIILTFLLAIFLALAKRRDDVIREELGETRTRKSVKGYNLNFLDHSMTIMGAVVIVAYLQYCHSVDRTIQLSSSKLYFSSAFVMIGLLRFMQLAFVEKQTGNPTKILINDHFTQINLFGWGCYFAWMLYL